MSETTKDNPDRYCWGPPGSEAAMRLLAELKGQARAGQTERDRPRRIEEGLDVLRAEVAEIKEMIRALTEATR